MTDSTYIHQNGYDIEIGGSLIDDLVTADIKYPCGELVEGWNTDSFIKAGAFIKGWLIENPEQANHEGCKSEYCKKPKTSFDYRLNYPDAN